MSYNRGKSGTREITLGKNLYEQKRYLEAEQQFRQSVQQRKKVLGAKHVDTLHSKYWLATSLHIQQKYDEAEHLLRQLVQQQEEVLGTEHKDTLYSKLKLAVTLHEQQKYDEAEKLLRLLVQQREKILGIEHVGTLYSKYCLAVTLYMQCKYGEAEQLLRQSIQQREKALGANHFDRLHSKYQLALTLHDQQKYDEAEQLLRQSIEQQEKVLGADHIDTLYSKYQLAVTLCMQQKYSEAEQLSRQSVQQRERVLGAEHISTLYSKYQLALTLYKQRKCDEAERLLHGLVQDGEKVFGVDHKDTLKIKKLLQKVMLAQSRSATATPLAEVVQHRLSDFFVEGAERRTAFDDSEIQQVSLLLSHINPQWSKVPRTYITLRTIGCLDMLDAFVDVGFSDHWFPVTERNLPHCLHPSKRSKFVKAQNLVMTKSLDLEKGDKGQHRNFQLDEPLPFEEKGILGTGGFGQVERVLSLISFKEYARKRVVRSAVFGGRRMEDINRFIAEIEVLKRLKHRHVVEFVGSYTDPKHMALIMFPVADMDLSTYLARVDAAKHKELRTFFGCLAKGLQFLHGQNVRHKDIKPGNILVHGGNVLFTDFGLSRDFTDADGSTTVGIVNAMTPRYCAPEVANYEPRNTSSDIWSLGVVFLEMTAVLKGRAVEFIYEFLAEHGSRQAFVRTNPVGFAELIAELKETGSPTDNVTLRWIQDMVMQEQTLRPTASALIASITAARESNGAFCGICCMLPDDPSDDFAELDLT